MSQEPVLPEWQRLRRWKASGGAGGCGVGHGADASSLSCLLQTLSSGPRARTLVQALIIFLGSGQQPPTSRFALFSLVPQCILRVTPACVSLKSSLISPQLVPSTQTSFRSSPSTQNILLPTPPSPDPHPPRPRHNGSLCAQFRRGLPLPDPWDVVRCLPSPHAGPFQARPQSTQYIGPLAKSSSLIWSGKGLMCSRTQFQDPRSERTLGMGPDNDIARPQLTRICQSWALRPMLALEGNAGPPERVRAALGGSAACPAPVPESSYGASTCFAVQRLPSPWGGKDCPKSPSGLVIPADGVELAGSSVFEREDRPAGSHWRPTARGTCAEESPSLLGMSVPLSLLPRGPGGGGGGGTPQATGNRPYSLGTLQLAGLTRASQTPRASEGEALALSPQDPARVG